VRPTHTIEVLLHVMLRGSEGIADKDQSLVGYDMDYLEDGRSKLVRNVCNKLSIDIFHMPEYLNLHMASCCRNRRFENFEIPSSEQYLSSQLPISLRSYPILSYPIRSSITSVLIFTFSQLPPSLRPYPILASHQFTYLQNQISLQSDLLTSPNFTVPTCK
jgi:hypothetical protein